MNPSENQHLSNKPFNQSDAGMIEQVFEGMRVEDAKGEGVGTVAFVKMGDANAATVSGDQEQGGGIIRNFQEALGFDDDPDLPPAIRERLLRVGYLKVDGSGLSGDDVYIPADTVANVTGDTVRLAEHLSGDTQAPS